jgi:general secretion pathway protein M
VKPPALGRLSPREQKLLAVLGALLGAFVVFGVPLALWSSIAGMREHNDEIRRQIVRIQKAGDALAVRRKDRETRELRFANRAPPLAAFVSDAAREKGLDVGQTQDRPEVKGKGFVERVTVVKMKKVALKPLVEMLEKIEGSGHPVAVTKLDIKSRAGGPDQFDVELAVSAFDKTEEKGARKDAAVEGSAGRRVEGAAPAASEEGAAP